MCSERATDKMLFAIVKKKKKKKKIIRATKAQL